MVTARDEFACTPIYLGSSNSDSPSHVVVAGGYDVNVDRTDSVEIYVIKSNEWISGPRLPKKMEGAVLTRGDGQRSAAILVGGDVGSPLATIYNLSTDLKKWTLSNKRLTTAREDHVAMNVPNGVIGCKAVSGH